jgi:hypothetical protein
MKIGYMEVRQRDNFESLFELTESDVLYSFPYINEIEIDYILRFAPSCFHSLFDNKTIPINCHGQQSKQKNQTFTEFQILNKEHHFV